MQIYLTGHFWERTPEKWSCLYWTDHHPHLACGSEKVCFNKLTLGELTVGSMCSHFRHGKPLVKLYLWYGEYSVSIQFLNRCVVILLL